MAKYESDNLNAGYCEYLTKTDASSKVVAARVIIILLAAILAGAMLVLTISTIPVVSFMLLVAIIFMAWFVFQFTKIEYEYTIATGTFILSKIYGARMRKDVLDFKTADITKITPYENLNEIKTASVLYTCSKKSQNLLCIVYAEKENGSDVLVISAPDKTISCLKFYKRSAFAGF